MPEAARSILITSTQCLFHVHMAEDMSYGNNSLHEMRTSCHNPWSWQHHPLLEHLCTLSAAHKLITQ